MPTETDVTEITPGDRVLLAECMEFKVVDKETKTIHDKVYDRDLTTITLELDDASPTDWAQDDTGSMSIVKMPGDTLPVLAEGEEIPLGSWQQ